MHGLRRMIGLGMLLLALPAAANVVQVANPELRNQRTDRRTVEVAFDLSWENSWRNDVNHDAAWVFIKFRAPGSNHWQHAYLTEANDAVNRVPGGVVELGSSAMGTATNAVGAFFYSANNRTGTVSYAHARLTWDYGLSGYNWAVGEELEISVHAVEMVYVAEGPFFVGSGGTESGSFTAGGWDTGATLPFAITNEGALEIGPEAGKLWGTSESSINTIGDEGTLPAAFPKGVAAFYCMKYEITQGQYVEFLDLLPYAQQNNRISGSPSDAPGTYPVGSYRHAIYIEASGVDPGTPAMYATDNPYVACNYLSWMDGAAYADWAGLRPMTELEFEKACRGPAAPVANEFAWGTTDLYSTGGSENYTNLGEYNESVNQGNVICAAKAPGGPARVGIFAIEGATRVSAGATYWGIMEMTGNLWERPVTVGNATGRSFTGVTGDGKLSVSGYADVEFWPGLSSGGVVLGATGAGSRGGHWAFASVHARVSDRNNAVYVYTPRANYYGLRAVRQVLPCAGP